jgi:hypothetical protein
VRIRTIKPEFWQDEHLAACSPEARLLAIGLLNVADDEGYFNAHPALVRGAVFPFDEGAQIPALLNELCAAGRSDKSPGYIELRRADDGRCYGRIPHFRDHQKINRPTPSRYAKAWDDLPPVQGALSESSVSPHYGNGMEGKGKEGCPERTGQFAPGPPPKQLDISFDYTAWQFKNITADDLAQFRAAYPAVDVEGEILRAAQWLRANPRRRKKQLRQFLTRWLSKEQERGGSRPADALPNDGRNIT